MKIMKIMKNIVIGITGALLVGINSAYAATCTIQGMNLITAYGKAKGNGYNFKCYDVRNTQKGFYSLPAPTKLGCRGVANQGAGVSVYLFHSKSLKNKWAIVDVTARGGPGTVAKVIDQSGVHLRAKPAPFQKYNIYITQMKIKHPSKGCGNMNTVLTSAFGS